MSEESLEPARLELDHLIASVFNNGPFYYYVIDFSNMALSHVSPGIREIHGLEPETVSFQDILDQIHPDDMDFVSRAEEKCIELVFGQMTPEKRKQYKMSYCFRFRNADGSYQLFNHQAIILTSDEKGKLSKALNIHTNISHLTDSNNYRLSLIGMGGEPSLLNIRVDDDKVPKQMRPIFSRREVEVLKLMSGGLTSTEIAGRLCISPNTVKNHRKNILRKAGCKNSGQLIGKCITEGLL
ncbi:LuxR C-terminal-related transcriptional regulator [Microbulbifer litoralis]|uniref:LuxR C-terminal-related transcriptional regulator n=1 Tax=Microbulbifer litoralis TaxID=2933965 RepID=UPI002028F964|nr:LuxR C-terminal-related transcriptional regulator [Microbulbifer sp. GX H0434]